jgi:cytochrome c peroxidase
MNRRQRAANKSSMAWPSAPRATCRRSLPSQAGTCTPSDIGIDDFQANRAPDKAYRTSPLKGLWTHTEGGFHHDGRFATLLEVVNHYDQFFGLELSDQQKSDLVEYLKSL